MKAEDCNILLLMLLNPSARRLFGTGWTSEARRVVARFRATHDLWAGDPAFIDLLNRLRKGCVEFEGWWDAHEIYGGASGTKRLRHPKNGTSDFTHASFQSNDDPNLRLVVYTPTGPASARKRSTSGRSSAK